MPDAALIARIRASNSSLQPMPTAAQLVLAPIEGTRAVLFDVYRILVITARGDIESPPTQRGGSRLCPDARDARRRSAEGRWPRASAPPYPSRPRFGKGGGHRMPGSRHPHLLALRTQRPTHRPASETRPTASGDRPRAPSQSRRADAGTSKTSAGLRRRGFVLCIISNAQPYTLLFADDQPSMRLRHDDLPRTTSRPDRIVLPLIAAMGLISCCRAQAAKNRYPSDSLRRRLNNHDIAALQQILRRIPNFLP